MAAEFVFEAIGTHWQIDVLDELTPPNQDILFKLICERIAIFDQHYSRFRTDSLVSAMAQKAGTYALPPDAEPLLAMYQRLYQLTQGAMTPLIGSVLVDAGYDAGYSLQPKTLRKPPAWEEVLAGDFKNLVLNQPALLDFGAAGKGYLIDLVAGILTTHGLTTFCVDAGGDMRYQSDDKKSLRVGLENPVDTNQAIGVATITNQSICGSAGNRRAWGEFHHIINPHTLTSPRSILAAWVVADRTLIADALTTALFFVPSATLRQDFNFEYVLMRADHSIEKSPGFPGEFFTA